MIKIKISDHDHSSFGLLTFEDFSCFVLGLPWNNNLPNQSRIPKGTYPGHLHISPKHGQCIKIEDVVGRTHILIHAGNFTREIKGCFLVGDSVKFLDADNIPDVTNSKSTLRKLLTVLPNEFEVQVA